MILVVAIVVEEVMEVVVVVAMVATVAYHTRLGPSVGTYYSWPWEGKDQGNKETLPSSFVHHSRDNRKERVHIHLVLACSYLLERFAYQNQSLLQVTYKGEVK